MKAVMKKVFLIISIEVLSFIAFIILAFAAFPNSTDGCPSFTVDAKNIIIYDILPLLLGIALLVLILFIIVKTRKFIVTSIVSFSLFEALMIAYSIYMYTAATPQYLILPLNLISCVAIATCLIILILFKKNKIFKIKEVKEN